MHNDKKEGLRYKLGVCSVSFRQSSPKSIVKATKEAGLDYIEWGSDVHAPYKDTKRLREISLLQNEYGVKCSSYGTYFRLGVTPIDELEGYIDAALLLGTDCLRLWCGDKSGEDMSTAEINSLFDASRAAAKIAEERAVKLCLECHRGTFTQNPHDSVRLMEDINSFCFRMYWQPFQWLDFAGSMESAGLIAPYTENIHVFNWHGDGKYPLCEGSEDWRGYLSRFSKGKTLLLEFMPDGRLESLAKEAAALRAIAGDGI